MMTAAWDDSRRRHISDQLSPSHQRNRFLPKMYGTVVIPRAVQEELLRPVAPEIVRAWIGGAPAWLEIRSPIDAPDSSLANLDPGERDAIMLATELCADQLIVDD